MPFKSEKQRKWMHTNEPEMAKKWEKEETIREKLKEIIREELLSERSTIDREYDQWHDASYALNKAVRNTKDTKLMKTFAKAWDIADTALLKWIEKNDPDYR